MEIVKNVRLLKSRNGPLLVDIQGSILPEPKAGEALVRILCCVINEEDVLMVKGKLHNLKSLSYPYVPGSTWVGVVESFGPGTAELVQSYLKIGDKVAASTTHDGFQQYRISNIRELIPIKHAETDGAEAATIVSDYLPAYQILHRVAHAKPTNSLLLLNPEPTMAIALIELARLHGITDIYATTNGENRQIAGAISITAPDWTQQLMSITKQTGVDIILEATGGKTTIKCFRCLKPSGKLISYGFSPDANVLDMARTYARFGLSKVLPFLSKASHSIYNMRTMKESKPEYYLEDIGLLFQMLAEYKLHPSIDARVSLEDAPKAFDEYEKLQRTGKMVVICDEQELKSCRDKGFIKSYD